MYKKGRRKRTMGRKKGRKGKNQNKCPPQIDAGDSGGKLRLNSPWEVTFV